MHPYSEAYLQEVVETQGKLFDNLPPHTRAFSRELGGIDSQKTK